MRALTIAEVFGSNQKDVFDDCRSEFKYWTAMRSIAYQLK